MSIFTLSKSQENQIVHTLNSIPSKDLLKHMSHIFHTFKKFRIMFSYSVTRHLDIFDYIHNYENHIEPHICDYLEHTFLLFVKDPYSISRGGSIACNYAGGIYGRTLDERLHNFDCFLPPDLEDSTIYARISMIVNDNEITEIVL